MLLEPVYGQNIIVGFIFNQHFNWYVTYRELWFLDYQKFNAADKDTGFSYGDFNNERNNIPVLDKTNALFFLNRIKELDSAALTQLLIDYKDSEDLLDFSPALLVNFDCREFYSLFPEPASFEDYVPDGWSSQYFDFTGEILPEFKYWIDQSGVYLLVKR
ncbi:hypothetical protein [Metabacillus sp. FJAT-52054]|uniref:Group-specific protein n=1 Tax=Metabacillus sediminis TaxID=3117746 RepID=A0ABZ2NNE2_9BACI